MNDQNRDLSMLEYACKGGYRGIRIPVTDFPDLLIRVFWFVDEPGCCLV